MEKIIKLKNLIEEALDKYESFDSAIEEIGIETTSMALKIDADKYLKEHQDEFIKNRYRANDSTAFLKKEIERIEGVFSMSAYCLYYEGSDFFDTRKEYCLFDAVEMYLPQGIIDYGGADFIAHILAEANFYLWLKEQEKEMLIEYPTPAQGKRLIWNGAKNALADVFYQLKNLNTDEKKPFLDASYERIAEFLKMNFECFNDTQIRTIKEYLEKDEKRPKKSTSKISVMRGFPPKN